MSIFKAVKEERMAAMKARDKEDVSLLGVIIADVQRKQDESDESVIKVIQAAIKNNNEFIANLAERDEAKIIQLEHENELLDSFLPSKLTGDKLALIVESKCMELGVTDMRGMGKIMGYLKQNYPDFIIDGNEVKTILVNVTK